MKRLESECVCHLLRDRSELGRGGRVGVSGVNVGSLLSAVHQSAVQAKWDGRYEEGRNYSADMMRDPGVDAVTPPPSSFSAAWPINCV